MAQQMRNGINFLHKKKKKTSIKIVVVWGSASNPAGEYYDALSNSLIAFQKTLRVKLFQLKVHPPPPENPGSAPSLVI